MTEKTTEDDLRKELYAEAREQTNDTLPAFLQRLQTLSVDYGTTCVAAAAASLAALSAYDKSPNGGLTGFQASAVFWEFARGTLLVHGPARLVQYEEMLFPQHKSSFEKTITPEVWAWLQKRAAQHLEDADTAHPDVLAHWQSIAQGKVPFGYTVKAL